jgi:peptidoglycan/xylan/chitin deacetylase (PgdA/CDA1 family)
MTTAGRAVSIAAAGTVVAAAGLWAPSLVVLAPRSAQAFGVRARFPGLDGVVLTFDDGPHPDGTPAVLAELDRASAPAIFFVTGAAVDRDPRLARAIVGAGHEIGIHGYCHQSRRQWTQRSAVDDTRRALTAVTVATGVRPRFYRPPHGTMTFPGRRAVRGLGLEPLLWSRWGRDWREGVTPGSIARSATHGIARGDVVLLHDSDAHGAAGSWRRTAAALPLVLEAIHAAGHRVVLPGA